MTFCRSKKKWLEDDYSQFDLKMSFVRRLIRRADINVTLMYITTISQKGFSSCIGFARSLICFRFATEIRDNDKMCKYLHYCSAHFLNIGSTCFTVTTDHPQPPPLATIPPSSSCFTFSKNFDADVTLNTPGA